MQPTEETATVPGPSAEPLERDAELAALQRALDDGLAARGRVVLVEGPAGIGKSRLLAAARERAAASGLRTLSARGSELERHAPLGVLRELLEPALHALDPAERTAVGSGSAELAARALLGDHVPPALSSEQIPFALVHSFYWLAVNLAERRPLLLACDDLHWADPASLRALVHLAARVDDVPVVLVAAIRTGEPAPPAELGVLRAEPCARLLRPATLSEAASAQLVRDALGDRASEALCRACYEAVGGSPFLLTELVGAVGEHGLERGDEDLRRIGALVPESVTRATIARIRRLGAQCTALARAVAVLEAAALQDAAALAGLSQGEAAQAGRELAVAGILAPDLPVRFAHPLQRTTVYSDLTPVEREAEHRRAARLLTKPAAVLSHLLRCDPRGDPWAVDALRAAGRRAVADGAPEAAARALRRALAEACSDDAPVELLLELGHAELACGDPTALDRYQAALERAGNGRDRSAVRAALGQARYLHGDVEGALAETRRALEEPSGADLDEAALLTTYVLAARASPAHTGAVRDLVQRPRPGAQSERARLACRAFDGFLRGERAAQLEPMARRGLDELGAAGTGVAMSHWMLAALGDFDAAEQGFAATLAAARRQGSMVSYAVASESRLSSRAWQGMVPQALADSETVIAMADHGWEAQTVTARCMRADLLLELGDTDGAARCIDIAPELESRLEGVWGNLLLPYARSGVAMARGEFAIALEQAIKCGERVRQIDADNPGYLPWRSRAAIAALRLGDRDRARRISIEQVALARPTGLPRAIGLALTTAGVVEGGRPGIALLTEAVQAHASSTARLERARSLVELGAALRKDRQAIAAREPLRQALDLALLCGATALADRARDELLASGARPRRARTSGPAALTPRELRVAALAADGLSNAEVAQALFVSRRTVESQLHSAYAKLGIAGREQLAAALAPQPADG